MSFFSHGNVLHLSELLQVHGLVQSILLFWTICTQQLSLFYFRFLSPLILIPCSTHILGKLFNSVILISLLVTHSEI